MDDRKALREAQRALDREPRAYRAMWRTLAFCFAAEIAIVAALVWVWLR